MPAATTLNTDLLVRLKGKEFAPQAGGPGEFDPKLEKLIQLASGVAANQANRIFVDTRTLAASATEDLDLAGVLDDPFNANIVFSNIVALIVFADPGNTNNVVLGNASATKWVGPFGAGTHTMAVAPGGVFVIACGGAGIGAVGAGATDFLGVTNSGAGTPVTYTIGIVGRT